MCLIFRHFKQLNGLSENGYIADTRIQPFSARIGLHIEDMTEIGKLSGYQGLLICKSGLKTE